MIKISLPYPTWHPCVGWPVHHVRNDVDVGSPGPRPTVCRVRIWVGCSEQWSTWVVRAAGTCDNGVKRYFFSATLDSLERKPDLQHFAYNFIRVRKINKYLLQYLGSHCPYHDGTASAYAFWRKKADPCHLDSACSGGSWLFHWNGLHISKKFMGVLKLVSFLNNLNITKEKESIIQVIQTYPWNKRRKIIPFIVMCLPN